MKKILSALALVVLKFTLVLWRSEVRVALLLLAFGAGLLCSCVSRSDRDEVDEIRIPIGAGGVGFLPFLVMREFSLVEKHTAEEGIPDLQVRWMNIGGPAVVNDALLSGSADFVAAGPPAFITLWDRTLDSVAVKGVAAMTSLPMYLNTNADHLGSLEDFTDDDKIAVTAIKVSIPALIMQMYAADRYGISEYDRFDRHTVTMTHPDGVVAILSGSGTPNAHFTSPPFHQRERQDRRVHTLLTSNDVMGRTTTFTMVSTTSAFRDRNPRVYAAVFRALEEATAMIRADREMAARLLLSSTEDSSFSIDEMLEVVNDPDVKFTTTPENIMKYADFMYRIGSISHRPESWDELFFPEIHQAPGS